MDAQVFGQPSESLSVAFVDTSLSQADILLEGLQFDRVEMISSQDNGIEQISQVLEQYDSSLESVHIFSKAQKAVLQLGSTLLTNDNLSEYTDDLSLWGKALNYDGDLVFYGSNLASKKEGRKFVKQIRKLRGCMKRVKASKKAHTV